MFKRIVYDWFMLGIRVAGSKNSENLRLEVFSASKGQSHKMDSYGYFFEKF